MIRTQVQLTEEQILALRERARRENLSVSEIVRRAVDAWVQGDVLPNDDERRRRAIEAAGRFGSGRRDVASDHDRHLSEILHP